MLYALGKYCAGSWEIDNNERSTINKLVNRWSSIIIIRSKQQTNAENPPAPPPLQRTL
jgi:hypothetical protein